MNILVSNDDGVEAPGLHALATALKKVGNITVVAPQRERSTTSHSLTLHKPLRHGENQHGYHWISGSPADCVYFATRHLLKKKPDIIVSGINRGANLGNDIHYSGTVAAAREGAYFGLKSVAVSLVLKLGVKKSEIHWDTAAAFVAGLVPQVVKNTLPPRVILNVNVPNVVASEIKGVKVSRQGLRYYADVIHERHDPRGRPYYWLGGEYQGFEDIKGTDCTNVEAGYISITPLRTDCTDDELLEELKTWKIDPGV